jgi:ABC-type uncharacterized transport system auxiliary subunit
MKPGIVSIFALLSILCAGCMAEKTIVMKYYVLEVPEQVPARNPEHRGVIRAVCEVGPTETSPLLETNQIINRSDSHEITYYRYHQWAIRPSIAVRELVLHQLESSGLFESVFDDHSRSIPDYRFTTSLQKLEVIENSDSFAARVKLDFSILDNENNRLLLGHQADRTTDLMAKDLNLFVREVSRIIQDELNVFLEAIEEQKGEFDKCPASKLSR